jgi:hypothetical protein
MKSIIEFLFYMFYMFYMFYRIPMQKRIKDNRLKLFIAALHFQHFQKSLKPMTFFETLYLFAIVCKHSEE